MSERTQRSPVMSDEKESESGIVRQMLFLITHHSSLSIALPVWVIGSWELGACLVFGAWKLKFYSHEGAGKKEKEKEENIQCEK
jgi:hypothetical protein